MTTFTVTKQITPATTQEIRFTVYSTDSSNPYAVARQVWQTSANTGEMLEHSSYIKDFVGNSRNLYRKLLADGWVAA